MQQFAVKHFFVCDVVLQWQVFPIIHFVYKKDCSTQIQWCPISSQRAIFAYQYHTQIKVTIQFQTFRLKLNWFQKLHKLKKSRNSGFQESTFSYQLESMKIMDRKPRQTKLWIPPQYCWTKSLDSFMSCYCIDFLDLCKLQFQGFLGEKRERCVVYYGVRKHYKKAHTSIKSVCHKKCDFGFYLPNLLFMLLLFYWSVNECKKPRVRRFGSYRVSR